MNHKVFISYSSKDKNIAEDIIDYIEEKGTKCWMAPRDIEPGGKFAGEITRGIKECEIFLLIYSHDSGASSHVKKEINLAILKEKTIIPFKIDNSEMNTYMEYSLSDSHWINAYPDPSDHFAKLE